jgi:pyruvate formate lyase activating enzyme
VNKTSSALILHLQRLSTEDGPGLRTTVFFKGCPLNCAWCHNPESISARPQIQWLERQCIGCQTCLQVCPGKCLHLNGAGMIINRSKCDACGQCAEVCPAAAMELLGIQVTVEEVFNEVIKDRSYFEKSANGGVTLSGGEPLMQADFCAALLKKLQDAGIHTALDTCGLSTPEKLEKVLVYTDLVLYDLKMIDSQRHLQFTGQNNQIILANLVHTSKYLQRAADQKRLWIRTPLIPGATAISSNIIEIGNWISENLGNLVERWELLTFNNLARDKYRRLDLPWIYAETPLMDTNQVAVLEANARQSGVDPAIVRVSGTKQG